VTFRRPNWKKMAIYSLLVLLATGGGLYLYAYTFLSGPVYRGPRTDHFDGKEFHNLEPIEMKGLPEVLKWQLNRDQGKWPDEKQTIDQQVPEQMGEEGIARVTFINHASFLIQSAGMNVLTDPIWSERASPFSWAGPKRLREPGVRFEDLPAIDVVLISHNHYDHLDLETLKRLQQVHDPLFLIPLGVDLLLQEHGLEKTMAMDWFDDYAFGENLISSVPVKHFSGRGLGDTNQTLWSGYMIETGGKQIFFAGDTGYGEFYKLIHERFGDVDLALLPIGAYRPRWFMRPIHMSPEEAVLAHLDVGAKQSIGMHFGTFPMADDGQEEPVGDMERARQKHGLPPEAFLVLKEGRWFDLK